MPDPAATADVSQQLRRCERALGYRFRDSARLLSALTHASGADHRLSSNERLEFLGDAILGAIVCEILFQKYPQHLEGELTRIKSVVVSRRTCAKLSMELGFDDFLILGKGMVSQQEETPPSVLADVFESLVAAIYLDGGMEAAKQFVAPLVEPEIDSAAGGRSGVNYKSDLQQRAQRQFAATPTYQVLDEKGPDHLKCFQVVAQIGDRRYAPAWGPNKKDAEQRAALNAISQLDGEPVPFEAD